MGKKKKFRTEELAGFCSQIATILKSGISLSEGIYMLSEEVEDKWSKGILAQIEEKLGKSERFYKALEETGAFPAYFVNMVKIGEYSGKLEDVMVSMEKYYQRECVIRSSIRNVISYPMMMFAMVGVILLVLVGKILPMFQKVFKSLQVDVASSSGRIMAFGMWTGRIVAGISILAILISVALILWYQTESGNKILKNFSTHFFVTKKTARLLAVGRFLSSMSVMTSSGMDTQESLEYAKDVVEHRELKNSIVHCMEQMKENTSFAESLREEKILTGMQGQMVSVAEKSGMLEEVLEEISGQYDEKISKQLGRFCMKVETSLVLALSIVVGGVLISVMFPLVSIITSIG